MKLQINIPQVPFYDTIIRSSNRVITNDHEISADISCLSLEYLFSLAGGTRLPAIPSYHLSIDPKPLFQQYSSSIHVDIFLSVR